MTRWEPEENPSEFLPEIRVVISRQKFSEDGHIEIEARLENGSSELRWTGTRPQDMLEWVQRNLMLQFPREQGFADQRAADAAGNDAMSLPAVTREAPPMGSPDAFDALDRLDMEFVDLTLRESQNGDAREIEASGRLRIYSGEDEGGTSFHVEFVLVNHDNGATQKAAVEQGTLQAGEWARDIRRTFPIPGKGNYSVNALVKTSSAGAVVAQSAGPTLRVVD